MMETVSELIPAATVLIVEDEFLIANDLRRILKKAGYRVLGLAESVAAAKGLVQQHPPTIVLLDIFLQGEETGVELAHWLSELGVPFVYLSANLTDPILEAAKVTQPLGVLNKPFQEKDVLATLEIARYRHAHGAEVKLRREQELQMAVNNAIVAIQDREELCLAIATQIGAMVPFAFFSLRIELPEEASRYWVVLRRNASEGFERIPLPAFLRGGGIRDRREEFGRSAPDYAEGPPATFNGPAFEALCAQNRTVRGGSEELGFRSLALFPVVLKRRARIRLHLASFHSDGFTPAHAHTVSLVIPQIALALDNLLASEEREARRQLKAAELAVVSAFQNGRNIPEIIPQVAEAINTLLPIDVLSLYRGGHGRETAAFDASVIKTDAGFGPLAEAERGPPVSPPLLDWQQGTSATEFWLPQPTLCVGPQVAEAGTSSPLARRYSARLGLKSALYVPLLSQGEPVAALLVASKAAYAFTAKDLGVLQELGRQAALALENLLAFERIKTLSEHLEQEKTYLREEIKTTHNFEEVIGTSPLLLQVFNNIAKVAPTDYTVLILGETGTGKELIARAVHNLSARRDRTMIKVNCAALPPQLIESELFGHERGSFTGATDQRIGKFELAHGSTIFLDEIGELPLELQAKLLRVIQEKEIERIGGKASLVVDVRIIAATNRNLQKEVSEGRFRSDLYYRLNVFPLSVPPLRERREDILPLATHFLHKIGKKLGKPLTSLATSSLQQMQQYSWPGNIRELEHVLERSAILAQTATVELAESLVLFPQGLVPPAPALRRPAGPMAPVGAAKPLQEIVREAILTALAQANNRIRGQGGAAELLHLKPTTLEARMKKLRIYFERGIKDAEQPPQATGRAGA